MSRATEFDWAIVDIAAERDAQDKQGGGLVHDDSHERFEWCSFIGKQVRAADLYAGDPLKFESRMIKVAALAIAAIESSRRQRCAERPDTVPAQISSVVVEEKGVTKSAPCSECCASQEHLQTQVAALKSELAKCLSCLLRKVVHKPGDYLCENCEGLGFEIWNFGGRKECPTCKGTGLVYLCEREGET